MSATQSSATADVIAALDRWQAETSQRRYPQLAVIEVVDRAASDHTYLAVTFAHGSDWHSWDVKPIADEFLTWLKSARPDLGGAHLAFLKERPDVVPGAATAPPDPERLLAELLAHARAFAVSWLDRIPATNTIWIPGGESAGWESMECVHVVEREDQTLEVTRERQPAVEPVQAGEHFLCSRARARSGGPRSHQLLDVERCTPDR